MSVGRHRNRVVNVTVRNGNTVRGLVLWFQALRIVGLCDRYEGRPGRRSAS